MTKKEAYGQACENGRKVGDAEGYARGKAEALAEAGDLISRKALLDVIAETAEGLADCDQQNAAWAKRKYAIRDITEAPTVDAVEVVRCRDCRWYNPELRICNLHSESKGEPNVGYVVGMEPDDFCSYGERRTDT